MQVMLDDIAACKRLGADGVVVGCLQPDGQVDAVTTATLVEAAQQNVSTKQARHSMPVPPAALLALPIVQCPI